MESCLSNKKIIIKVKEEDHAMHIPKGKNGHIKFEGTTNEYPARVNRNNEVETVLTDKEQVYLENRIDATRPKGWLSPYKSKDNAWVGKRGYKVKLGLEPTVLDLSNPIDYIKYKIALQWKSVIAKSFEERLNKQYTFYMEDKEQEEANKSEEVDVKIKASTIFAEVSKSQTKLIESLMVVFQGSLKDVPDGMTLNTAKAALYNYLEKYPRGFIELMEDNEFELKAILYKALRRGVINRDKYTYNLGMGDGRRIGEGIREALDYIKDLRTNNGKQEEFMKFKAALK